MRELGLDLTPDPMKSTSTESETVAILKNVHTALEVADIRANRARHAQAHVCRPNVGA